jgi:aryl-alcohol dehydrogenase-like predicted oxidoreductase
MKYHPLPGTDLRLSTFCCGLGDLFTAGKTDESDKLLDAYIEAGGNFFDTAHMYCHWLPGGNGLSEISIGDYVRRRGLKEVIIATKGGCGSLWRYRKTDDLLSPGRLIADIDDSLGRLEIDTIPLYYMHRDDPRVPVSVIMDTLHAEIGRGRIRYLGASNWRVERLAEANEYARSKNLQPFVIVEPNWSLAAHKVRFGLNSPGEVDWYRRTQMPVAPFSPTAQGFFTGTAKDSEKAYGTPENHARRERAAELAQKYQVTPTQIALAWLINHPFPVFPILGTSNPERLEEGLGAEDIKLTQQELVWLEQG